MGIILGLAAALCWGAADFLARYATRLTGTYRTLFFMQFVGFAVLSVYLFSTGTFGRVVLNSSLTTWGWAIGGSLISVGASLALYRAFEVGTLAIVSPIAASSAALTVVLSFISGETIHQLQGVGIAAALIGVVLAATHFTSSQASSVSLATPVLSTVPAASASMPSSKEEMAVDLLSNTHEEKQKSHPMRGVGWALIASVGYGIVFWVLGFHIRPAWGGVAPVWFIRVVTICVLALCALPTMRRIALPRGASVWWFLLGVGTLDTAAFVCASIALVPGQVAIVSVLASLFSAVTVILAWIFLRDRLQWSQWLGIGIIFIAIVMVNLN